MGSFIGGLAGLIFGLGLIVSGMVQPAKGLGFLDLAGAWDPSLALVMAGAIAVGLPAFACGGPRVPRQRVQPCRGPLRLLLPNDSPHLIHARLQQLA